MVWKSLLEIQFKIEIPELLECILMEEREDLRAPFQVDI